MIPKGRDFADAQFTIFLDCELLMVNGLVFRTRLLWSSSSK